MNEHISPWTWLYVFLFIFAFFCIDAYTLTR